MASPPLWCSRGLSALAAFVMFAACGATLLTIEIAREASTVVEGGTLLESLVGDVGLSELVFMDFTSVREIVNQGVEPGDINEVRFTQFQIEVTAPSDGDLSFIQTLDLFVEAPDLPRVRIAGQGDLPEGAWWSTSISKTSI